MKRGRKGERGREREREEVIERGTGRRESEGVKLLRER